MENAAPRSETRFSDIVLDDTALSMAAKGIFVTVGYLGNGSTMADLEKKTSDSLENIQQYVNELVNAGYVNIESGDEVHIKSAGSFGVND